MFEKRQRPELGGFPRESLTETNQGTALVPETSTNFGPAPTAPVVFSPGTGPVRSSVDGGEVPNTSNTDTATLQQTVTNLATSTPGANPALVTNVPVSASSSSKGT